MMKNVKITLIIRMTDEFYEGEFKDVKRQILSGELQRDLKKEGITSVKATMEVNENLNWSVCGAEQ